MDDDLEADRAEDAAHEAKLIDAFRQILLSEYDEELLQICERALSPATLAVYDGELRRFQHWCGERGLTSLPAQPETVALYLGLALEEHAVSYSGLKRMHAGISYHHRIRNLPDPAPGPHP